MPARPLLQFGAYRLDGSQGQLLRHDAVLHLPPKALAVLWCLASQAGQVVTKEALLDTVWADTVVSEGVLTACIRDLRRALDDDARQPRYIETVHRRGYRFVAPVEDSTSPLLALPAVTSPDVAPVHATVELVGRDAEMAQLHAVLERARGGQRQTLFVTGEPGIGKTALVEACFEALAAPDAARIGWGQCVEHYGPGAAYLPVLEALGRLCRGPAGPTIIGHLRQWAPAWLAQLSGVLPPAEREQLQRQARRPSRERMLRELVEALEALTREQLLVLVLEDLHWSDTSTVEVLTMLARRRELARLLVLGTYRPAELILRAHPLKQAKAELQLHGHCAELVLGPLPQEAVAAYVAQHFPAPVAAAIAPAVYQHTDGHPLFMAQVAAYLAPQVGLDSCIDEAVATPVAQALEAIPSGVQQLIELQLERLRPDEQQVLAMASVIGVEFAVASVAAGLQVSPEGPEAVCETLARQGPFLEACGLAVWPDGTLSGRYRFRHALYQAVLYRRLAEVQRVQGHQRIGARLETGYGARAGEIAVELAVHFERGRDPERALTYHTQAGTYALTRFAYQEAIMHLTTGLVLLETLPATQARTHQELVLLVALGPALIVTKGQASADVERVYTRAYDLSQHDSDPPQLFSILRGLWMFYAASGQFQTASELGKQLFAEAQHAHDPVLLLEAHRVLAPTCFFLGELAAAREHAERGMALYVSHQHDTLALHYGQNSGVACLAFAAWALWHLGYPDQALRRSYEALALARRVSHPHSLALAHYFTAAVHQFRREVQAVQTQATAAHALSTTHGFAWYAATSAVQQGWVLAVQGQGEAGLTRMIQGLGDYEITGAALHRTYFGALLAEAQARVGQVRAGLRTLTDAFKAVHNTGERVHEAELYRFKGELLLARRDAQDDAEACFLQALTVARGQSATSWELRAAMSLARLWQRQGKRQEARGLLTAVYDRFTEGFGTSDLQEARALLDDLTNPTGPRRC
jgi:predicted ATPase/DNA-binding winged helix-turn-helix (wHTH) protein